MALEVFLAHTGQLLQADPASFTSLEDFRKWLAKHGSVQMQNQILLTGEGKAVRAATLRTEQHIFVFDRRFSQPSTAASTKSLVPVVASPDLYEVEPAPDEIATQTDLQSWQALFKARRSWALRVVDDCAAMSDEAQLRFREIAVIAESLGAATANLESHIKTLDEKFSVYQNWGAEVQKEHGILLDSWEGDIERLRALPAAAAVVRFVTKRETRRNAQTTLEDLMEIEGIKAALKIAGPTADDFSRRLSGLATAVDSLINRTEKVNHAIQNGSAPPALRSQTETIHLLEDIEALAKKVNSDYDTVLGYSDTEKKSLAQASKTALIHTEKLLPSLSKRSIEMSSMLKHATDARNRVAQESASILQTIAQMNTDLGETNAELASLEIPIEAEQAFETLSAVRKLPVVYSSLLAEAIRRREWNEKVKTDSSTLANEMATFQHEEQKRRRKWQKDVGTLFNLDKREYRVLGLEVNLLGEEDQWPEVTRQDLDDLQQALQRQGADAEVIAEVAQIVNDLNNPTKQQTKRAKAFKAGSVHEAALGRSALLMRGDDDLIRSLEEEKSRIETKLKAAESRVRRLEDLLHRQSHVRIPSDNIFQIPGAHSPAHEIPNPLQSPRLPQDISRRSSVSSRRFSANRGEEEKAHAQRLLALEAELIAEREKVAGLEREISARVSSTTDMKNKMDEADSTKKDLMENFEAQQREFAEERMALEGEIRNLKAKLDEVEEDVYRLIGSRENEKSTIDERTRSLQQELDRVRKDAVAETQKAQGQVDYLRNDAKLQRETNETLQAQLQRLRDENQELKASNQQAKETENQYLADFKAIHSQLLPTKTPAKDAKELVEALLSASADLMSQHEVDQHDLAVARSNSEEAEKVATSLREELEAAKEKLVADEQETFQLREDLSAHQAKFEALEKELADEREQLASLRSKFAEGETGSEALRSRVEEEERKVTELSEELASERSKVGSLEEELRMLRENLHTKEAKSQQIESHFEARTLRAKDLTQRLYAQNDRLCRLLERLSYSVTRQDGSMTIQRIPRAERTNPNDSSDPSSSMRRSLSLAPRTLTDSADLSLLHWTTSSPTSESTAYDSFLSSLGNFDIEAFCETILKRIKDAEHIARKYTKDARAYREKSHTAQKEAHEKIAYKAFKEGDLALFLPTRNQETGAWAAFNVGAPHYFLREQDSHRLRTRDWLVARIHKIEERVVDLSKSISSTAANHMNNSERRSIGETSTGGESVDDDNPFNLSDGLRWFLIDAFEEKPGAPSTPGLGKSTVAAANIDATGSIQRRSKRSSGIIGSGADPVSKTLSKSLDSRRSSSNSKTKVPAPSLLRGNASDASRISVATAPEQPLAESERGEGSVMGAEGGAETGQNAAGQNGNAEGKAQQGQEVRDFQQIDSLLGP